MTNIAIFASGSGTNAENIIHFFSNNKDVTVTEVYCNKKDAGVIDRAKNLNINSFIFNRDQFYNGDDIVLRLKNQSVDYIILAGFLWLIPTNILKEYKNKIINIHPSLLPKYGGKGMYGENVHKAVFENKDSESGITIHLVDEIYDNGKIIFQARCWLDPEDTPDTIAEKVHTLEYEHFPPVIQAFITENSNK